jgi:hypothetical protein
LRAPEQRQWTVCFAVGDFNGDGTADVALAGNNSLGGSDIDVFFRINMVSGSKKK